MIAHNGGKDGVVIFTTYPGGNSVDHLDPQPVPGVDVLAPTLWFRLPKAVAESSLSGGAGLVRPSTFIPSALHQHNPFRFNIHIFCGDDIRIGLGVYLVCIDISFAAHCAFIFYLCAGHLLALDL